MFWVIVVGILLFWANRGFHGAILSGTLSNLTIIIGTFIQFVVVVLYFWWVYPKMKKLDEEFKKKKE